LLEVLRLRGEEKGSRLKALPKEKYTSGMWGYVREVAPDWTWLKTHDGQELKDFLPRSVYKKATDWVLEDNYSTKVAVISDSFGYAQSVSKLLKTVGLKPLDAEPDDNGFEMLDACTSFLCRLPSRRCANRTQSLSSLRGASARRTPSSLRRRRGDRCPRRLSRRSALPRRRESVLALWVPALWVPALWMPKAFESAVAAMWWSWHTDAIGEFRQRAYASHAR
jgi:hypothetical protein